MEHYIADLLSLKGTAAWKAELPAYIPWLCVLSMLHNILKRAGSGTGYMHRITKTENTFMALVRSVVKGNQQSLGYYYVLG